MAKIPQKHWLLTLMENFNVQSWYFMAQRVGPGVRDTGDTILLRFHGPAPSDAQLQMVIKRALEKGWTDIFALDKKGSMDQQTAARLRNIADMMGVPPERLRIHSNPAIYAKYRETGELPPLTPAVAPAPVPAAA